MTHKQYETYKPSGIEWLGNIPEHWDVKRLKFVGQVVAGQSPDNDSVNNSNNGLPFLQGKAEFGNIFPCPVKWCNAPKKIASRDSILMSVRAPVGDLNWANQELCIGRGLSSIIPNISKRYMYRILEANKDILRSLSTGTTFEAITSDDINELPIICPPLSEQQAIAEYLDLETGRIDTLIAKKEQFIKLLSLEIDAKVHEAINHKDIINIRFEYLVKNPQRFIDRASDEEFSAIGLYNRGRGIFHKEPCLSKDLGDSDFSYIKSGDLIFSGQFAWEGAVALAQEKDNGKIASHRYPVYVASDKYEIEIPYLYAYFKSHRGQFLMEDSSRGSAGRNRPLNTTLLEKEYIPVPPIELQKEISLLIYKQEKIKIKSQQMVEKLKEYRKSIITHAVTGKIKVI